MSGRLQLSLPELIDAGFVPRTVADHPAIYYAFDFDDGYELTLEPLLFGRWTLALYRHGHLVMPAKLELPPRRST